MATPPKVSVIVPSYNHAPYLAQRLDSILAQTFQDFELLFLDDASPDHTREVFARYAQNPRIRAVLNERNSGNVFKQWNRGLGMAQGEYVWIAESDDYADPEFLATLVARLEAHPEVGVAYCESRKVNPAGEPLGLASEWYGATYRTDRWRSSFVAEGVAEARDYALAGSPIANASCAEFRRSLAQAVGGAPEQLRLTGDWLFWVTLFGSAKVAFECRALNFYRQHEGSVSSHSVRSGVDLEEFYRVANHVRSQFSPAPELVERTRIMLFDRWFWRSLRRDAEITWGRHRRIYFHARQFDPGIGRRFVARWLQARAKGVLAKLRSQPEASAAIGSNSAPPLTPAATSSPGLIFVEHGAHGLTNLGDVAMLRVAVSRLRELFPESPIYVAAYDAERLRMMVPEATWCDGKWSEIFAVRTLLPACFTRDFSLARRLDRSIALRFPRVYLKLLFWRHGRGYQEGLGDMDRLLQSASLVVLSGGGFINGEFPQVAFATVYLSSFAVALGKRVAWFGQGVGPACDARVKRLLRRLLPKLEVLTVRDAASLRLVRDEVPAASGQWVMAGDDAMAVTRVAARPELGDTLGFGVRVAAYSGWSAPELQALAERVSAWAEGQAIRIRCVSISFGAGESDQEAADRSFAKQPAYDANPIACDLDALLTRVQQCRVVVTGTYHAAVFALGQGIPVVALARNPYYRQKFAGLSDQFGEACTLLSQEELGQPDRVLGAIARAWDQGPTWRAGCLDRADELIAASRAAYARLLKP